MARHATARPDQIQIFRDQEEIGAWSDERLLRRFLERSGRSAEAAFAVLIERHGSIVYRVCLDVLRGPDEAQDAAQAVFLILAKKAVSIRKPGSLGSWLHGVALRVARRARGETIRGTGGAGGIDRNIEIATVTEGSFEGTGYFYGFNMDFGTGRFEYRLGNAPVAASRTDPRVRYREGRSRFIRPRGRR